MCIKKEQINAINSKCSNGWTLDVQYFIHHGEKTLIKTIDIDNENYLEFAIRYNYKNQVTLHISKNYHKIGEYFSTSNGLGKNAMLDETQAPRKNVNKLIDFTKKLTNAKLLEINKNTKVLSGNGIFFPSEDF